MSHLKIGDRVKTHAGLATVVFIDRDGTPLAKHDEDINTFNSDLYEEYFSDRYDLWYVDDYMKIETEQRELTMTDLAKLYS